MFCSSNLSIALSIYRSLERRFEMNLLGNAHHPHMPEMKFVLTNDDQSMLQMYIILVCLNDTPK
jgi:hypothetical protein